MIPTTSPYSAATPSSPTPSPTHPRNDTRRRLTWDELMDAVRDAGQYATTAEAARVTRIVLSALGGHVTGEARVDLARHLPEEAARLISSQVPVTRPLTAAEFVDAVATRIEGATPATARWDVSSVLSTLPHMVGAPSVARVLAQLPPGYALLF
ncbi:DUF2267 domain-containing protein, partial [Streptomyces phyllanthi]|nr:DUF2267 domain-containing protein [Streptomyces phyllanthi]